MNVDDVVILRERPGSEEEPIRVYRVGGAQHTSPAEHHPAGMLPVSHFKLSLKAVLNAQHMCFNVEALSKLFASHLKQRGDGRLSMRSEFHEHTTGANGLFRRAARRKIHSHTLTHTNTHIHTRTHTSRYRQAFCSRTTRYSVRVCVDMSRTRTQACAPTDVFTRTYNVHLKTPHTLKKI